MSRDTVGARYAAAREDRNVVVLEGFHAVKHCLRFGGAPCDLVTDDLAAVEALCASHAPDLQAAVMGLVQEIAADLFVKLVPRAPGSRLLAIAATRQASATDAFADATRPVVLLDEPRAVHNLGAVIRVAAGANAASVVSVGTVDPWSAAAVRASAGLHYALPVAHLASDELPSDRTFIGLDPDGDELLVGAQCPEGTVLVFGNERHGISNALSDRLDRRWRLPMQAGVSSLNLATSVAATLYRLGS